MDYARIYRDFITDRSALENGVLQSGEYAEKHHIVPKSVGGVDAPENILALRPEDHIFAHLLLAKIYGGKMWAPLVLMTRGRVGKKYVDIGRRASRLRYGWVMRKLSETYSGEGAHQYDWATYRLIHKDGATWSGRQSEMPDLGISKSLANMLVKGRVKTAMGWRREETEEWERGGANHPMYRPEVHEFEHDDGTVFVGTQHELSLRFGVPKPSACMLARGQRLKAGGWMLKGANRDYRRGLNNPNVRTDTFTVEHEDGRRLSGIMSEIAEAIGGSRGNIHALLVSRRRRVVKGWRLKDG
jgi:hypothetical protein